MPWEVWLILGFIFLALELFFPTGFYLFIFGIGAILTGAVTWVGLVTDTSYQLVSCAVLTLICLFALRKPLMGFQVPAGGGTYQELIGDEVIITSEIGVQGLGKGELRGSSWSIKNVGPSSIAAGERCKVVRVEGITLSVTNEK